GSSVGSGISWPIGRYSMRPSPAKVSPTPVRNAGSAALGPPPTYAVSLPAGCAAAVAAPSTTHKPKARPRTSIDPPSHNGGTDHRTPIAGENEFRRFARP